jgi:hypothetical protein
MVRVVSRQADLSGTYRNVSIVCLPSWVTTVRRQATPDGTGVVKTIPLHDPRPCTGPAGMLGRLETASVEALGPDLEFRLHSFGRQDREARLELFTRRLLTLERRLYVH